MVENPEHQISGEIHKHHDRRLHGFRLWLARAGYFVLFALVLTFFFVGLPGYLEYLNSGGIGLTVTPNAEGSLVVSFVFSYGDAAGVGVRQGDVVMAVNGIPNPSAEQATNLINGKIGAPVSITVRTGNQAARTYAFTINQRANQLLAKRHLSLKFLGDYNLVFSCLLTAGVFLTSLLVFLRRSKDWLVILVAFSMIALAAFLMTPVKFGAYKLHVAFMFNLIYIVGMVAMILVFFLFPSGHFEPHWTRWAAIFIFIPALLDFSNLQTVNNYLLDFLLWFVYFILAAFAQVYRYWRVATPTERQQTKLVVSGAVAFLSIIAVLDLVSILIPPYLTYIQNLIFTFLIVKAGGAIPVLVLDLSFVLAIYHYRLWDTDLYINRTLVYSVVTLFLMLVWVLTTQVLNFAAQTFFGKQITWLGALLSSLQVAVIYKPVRKWVEKWINSRFYKDRIDYSEALVELRPEMWNFLTPADLAHALVSTIPTLLQSTSAALFIQERPGLTLIEVQNMHPSEAYKFNFSEEILKKLSHANVVNLPAGGPFAMLVPLTVSRLKVFDLIGVLAFGPRTQGRGYSRDHLNDLSTLGRNAGTALYMLKLNDKKRLKEIPSAVEA